MNREQVDKLFELYKQGLTSSDEEQALINHFGNSRTRSEVWFNYIKNQKKLAPNDLESQIWS